MTVGPLAPPPAPGPRNACGRNASVKGCARGGRGTSWSWPSRLPEAARWGGDRARALAPFVQKCSDGDGEFHDAPRNRRPGTSSADSGQGMSPHPHRNRICWFQTTAAARQQCKLLPSGWLILHLGGGGGVFRIIRNQRGGTPPPPPDQSDHRGT